MTRFQKLTLFAFVLLAFLLSYRSWMAPSEFWPITASGHWDKIHFVPSLLYKPLFHGILSLFYWVELDSVQHILAVKLFSSLISGFMLILVLFSFRKMYAEQTTYWVFLAFMSMPILFGNLGKVRSDEFALFVFSIAYLSLIHLQPERSRSVVFVFLIGILSMIAVTPKAALLVVPLGTLLYKKIGEEQKKLLFRHIGTMLFVVSGATILLVMSNLPWLNAGLSLWNYTMSSIRWNYGILTAHDDPTLYYSRISFLFLALVMAWHLVTILQSLEAVTKKLRQVSFLLFWMAIPFFFYPAQGFFLAAWVVTIPFLFQISISRIPLAVFQVFMATNLLALVLGGSSLFRTMDDQLQTLRVVDEVLNRAGRPLVMDGIGLLPRQRNNLTYIGPFDQNAIDQAEQSLLDEVPDFVIFTPRIVLLSSRAIESFGYRWYQVGPGYFAKSKNDVYKPLESLPAPLVVFGIR